jgi:integrase
MAWVERRGNKFRVRFRQDDGTVATDSMHDTRTAAKQRAADIGTDQRRDVFINPQDGKMLFREWVEIWQDAHEEVSAATWAKYQSHLDVHLLPRFGDVRLADISRLAVKTWAKALGRRRAPATVADVVGLLSMLMGEAVEEHRISINPCRRVLSRESSPPERPWATAAQVLALADRAVPRERVLIIAAAYTGMRWGELAGLRRPACQLDDARLIIDRDAGALHEVGGTLQLGPPKTPAAVRTVRIPPFLVAMLRGHLDSHDHPHVFIGRDGGLLRRSNFARRMWRPAADGNPRTGVPPVITGMHFHDLRHTHKTWLIEDGVPEVAQCKRLGHRLPGVPGRYSHVTELVEQRLVDGLQRRWEQAAPHRGA